MQINKGGLIQLVRRHETVVGETVDHVVDEFDLAGGTGFFIQKFGKSLFRRAAVQPHDLTDKGRQPFFRRIGFVKIFPAADFLGLEKERFKLRQIGCGQRNGMFDFCG